MTTPAPLLDPYRHMTVKHHFIGGIYTKELHIPPGETHPQHRHSFDHTSVLVSGEAIVEVDGVATKYSAPAVINIRRKTIHSITPITPIVWLCQHVTECTDPTAIDEEFIDHG